MEIHDFAEYLAVWTCDHLAAAAGIDLISFSPPNPVLSPDSTGMGEFDAELKLIRYQLVAYAERKPKAVHLNFYYSLGQALELSPPFKMVNWLSATEAGCDWLIFSILTSRQSDALDLIKSYVDKFGFTIQGGSGDQPGLKSNIRPQQWH